jgi:hypothetical protein
LERTPIWEYPKIGPLFEIMMSMDADLRSGRRLETGRRSESIIYTVKPVLHDHAREHLNRAVIDFSSGPRPVKIDSEQWLLPIFFNRIYINILILKFSGQ